MTEPEFAQPDLASQLGRLQHPHGEDASFKHLTCERLTVRSPGCRSFATVQALPSGTGVWVSSGSGPCSAGLVVQDVGHPYFVLYDQNGAMRMIHVDDLIAAVKTIPLGSVGNAPPPPTP